MFKRKKRKLQGVVKYVKSESFIIRLYSEDGKPEYSADMPKTELEPHELEYLEPGAVVIVEFDDGKFNLELNPKPSTTVITETTFGKRQARGIVTYVDDDIFIIEFQEEHPDGYELPPFCVEVPIAELSNDERNILEVDAQADAIVDDDKILLELLALSPKRVVSEEEWNDAWSKACEMLAELEDDEEDKECIRSMSEWPKLHRKSKEPEA